MVLIKGSSVSILPVVWFWQDILSPHMSALAAALADLGLDVTYVANERMSVERTHQGWEIPPICKVKLALAESRESIKALVLSAPANSVHICQGLRGNGLIGYAQRLIRMRGLKHWAIMETVDDSGWLGIVKRIVYRSIFWYWGEVLEGVLAIGRDTPRWMSERGMPRSRVFPFAYFLREPERAVTGFSHNVLELSRNFRFIFVGQFIELKRLGLLIDAITTLNRPDIELWVVGSGPLELELRDRAARLLPCRVRWLGVQPMHLVPPLIAAADCLVLPSRYDGWGAVVSEALMVGTPVICSDACGAAEAVLASGVGHVFRVNEIDHLIWCLRNQADSGVWPSARREAVVQWARSLGAKAGADYLTQLLELGCASKYVPDPPWYR